MNQVVTVRARNEDRKQVAEQSSPEAYRLLPGVVHDGDAPVSSAQGLPRFGDCIRLIEEEPKPRGGVRKTYVVAVVEITSAQIEDLAIDEKVH
jgi:hypothetical protein